MMRTGTSRRPRRPAAPPRRLEHRRTEAAGHDALLERHDQPLAARLRRGSAGGRAASRTGIDDADRPALGRPAPSAASSARATIGPKPTNSRSRPRAATRPARPAGRPAPPAPARSPGRAGSAARTGGPGRAPVQQRAQLLLVLGRGDDEVRQLALGRDREHALVARAVLADQPGPVDRDEHRLVVLADVVDGLVERAAGRSSRAPRPAACRPWRGPVASVTACCSAMPTSKKPVRGSRPGTSTCPVPVGMPAVIATIAVLGRRQLDQLGRQDRGVVRGLRRPAAGVGEAASSAIDSVGIGPGALSRRAPVRRRPARPHRRQAAPWKPTWSVIGRLVAAALLGPDVDDDRARQRERRGRASRAAPDVVAGHDADVGDAEVLEQLARAGRSSRPTSAAGATSSRTVRPDDRHLLDQVDVLPLLARATSATA